MTHTATAQGDERRATYAEAIRLARLFHQTYEELAPEFGYETRPETREFKHDSTNGALMVEVMRRLLPTLSTPQPVSVEVSDEQIFALGRHWRDWTGANIKPFKFSDSNLLSFARAILALAGGESKEASKPLSQDHLMLLAGTVFQSEHAEYTGELEAFARFVEHAHGIGTPDDPTQLELATLAEVAKDRTGRTKEASKPVADEQCVECGIKFGYHDSRCSHAYELAGSTDDDDPIQKCDVCGGGLRYGSRHHQCGSAIIAAVKQALAAPQPSQEPDAWQERQQTAKGWTDWYDAKATTAMGKGPGFSEVIGGIEYQWRPLYATPHHPASAEAGKGAIDWNAERQTDQAVTAPFVAWLSRPGQHCQSVGANEAWNAGVAWARASLASPQPGKVEQEREVISDGAYLQMARKAGATVPEHGAGFGPPRFDSFGEWGRFCDEVRAASGQTRSEP